MVSSERSVDLTWFSFTWSFLSFFLSFPFFLFFLSFFLSFFFLLYFLFFSLSLRVEAYKCGLYDYSHLQVQSSEIWSLTGLSLENYAGLQKKGCKKICKIFASELGSALGVMRGFQKGMTLDGQTSRSDNYVGLQKKVAKKFAKFLHLSQDLSRGSWEVSEKV